MKRISKWWNKVNNNLSSKQEQIISNQYKEIIELYKNKANKVNSSGRKHGDKVDAKCPQCRGESIVDKISHVQGEGKTHGEFSLGFGIVSGSSSMDTSAVNHCNSCGHEWKKSNYKYVGVDKLLGDNLSTLSYYMDGSDWAKIILESFKSYYAETMILVFDEVSHHILYSQKPLFKLKKLRKYFKSIFDE